MSKIIKSADAFDDYVLSFERDPLKAIAPPEPEEEAEEDVDPEEELRIRHEAILAEARDEAKRKVQEAYDEGLRRGTEAGQTQFAEAVGEASQTLSLAAEEVKKARDEFLSSLEPQIVDLVRSMTEQVLRREVRSDPELIRSTARAALMHLLGHESIRVRVNPQDLKILREEKEQLLDEFEGVEQLEIVADESIGSGGCIADSGDVYVDGQIDTQLQRILDALTD